MVYLDKDTCNTEFYNDEAKAGPFATTELFP